MTSGSGSGLYPLDVSNPHPVVTTKNASRTASCCLGSKIAPGDFKSTMANYHAVTQNKLFNHKGPASLSSEKEVVIGFTVHSCGLDPMMSPRRVSL